MQWWQFALCGLAGGAIIDGIEFWRAVRGNKGRIPEEFRTPGFALAEAIRLLSGATLAWAFGTSGEISTALAALTVGVTAPLVVEKLARAASVPVPQTDTGAEKADATGVGAQP